MPSDFPRRQSSWSTSVEMAALYRLPVVAFVTIALFCEINGNLAKPIRIADVCEENGGKISLNRNSLARVLLRPELKGKRLMIISILGSMRKAKSFIMNYPKRYLASKGWDNPDWMGDSKTTNNDGFSWRKGTIRETIGIDVWGEIFTIQDSNGEEVVVLLMDTQGLFDTETTAENNAKLFAYSTLASSLQILNFQGLVEERDLQNLQFSAEFSRVAATVDRELFKLPELLVLIQNWAEEDEYEFGSKGGKKYLHYLLAPRQGNEELNSVRETLVSSFQEMECYLLPHPGLNVTRTSFKGANEELGSDYLRHVKSFVEWIFDKKDLPFKKWQGEPMTPEMLYNFLLASDDALQSDGMPKVETLAEAYSRSHYGNQFEKSLEIYEREMDAQVGDTNVIKDVELMSIHHTSETSAVDAFKAAKRIGPDTLEQGYRNRLNEEIVEKFEKTKRDMDVRKKEHMRKLEEKYFRQYTENMEEMTRRKDVGLQEIDTVHLQKMKTVMKLFNDEASVCDSFAPAGSSRLERSIIEHFNLARNVLIERRDAEEARRKAESERKNALEAEKRAQDEKAKRDVLERRLKEERSKRRRGFLFQIGPLKIHI